MSSRRRYAVPSSLRRLSAVPVAPVAVLGPALGLAALLLVAGCSSGDPPDRSYAAPRSRPHILIYMVDTLRADHLGVYGWHRDTSPHLDRLAGDGVVFETAYAPSSWTRASVASLLTGLPPVEHGATSRRHRLPPRLKLVSEHLSGLGYRTHAVVTNPHVVEHWGFDQGFDRFVVLGTDDERWADVDAGRVNRELQDLLPGPEAPPTFLYVHTIDPHAPNDPVEPYDRLFTEEPRPALRVGRLDPGVDPAELENLVALYDAEIRYADDHFGELIEELRRRGVYDDTLIVFVSDHGEEHLDHGRGGHGQQLFEEVVRVPLVVKFPGGELAGRRVEVPASLLDVAPTVLRAAGDEVAPELDGIDLARMAREPSEAAGRPLFLDLELRRYDDTLHVARGVVYRGHKYIEEVLPEPRRMLFDLASDPGEKRNLLADDPAAGEPFAAMLENHREEHRGGLHLLFVGPPDGPELRVRGRVAASGGFHEVRRRRFEAGDGSRVLPSGAVTFDVGLEPFEARSFGDGGEPLQDHDALLLRTDPAGEPVTLESLSAPDDFPVYLGSDRVPAAELPLQLSSLDPELAIASAGQLLQRETTGGEPLPQGLYVVAVPPVGGIDAGEFPEHLRSRFEALGYL